MTFAETAYAKINLALHVRGRRSDGYHDIETIFAFADFGDALTAAPADAVGLTIGGPFAAGLSAGSDNLVMRAAAALADHGGIDKGAALALDKRLPVASGIGGGSADAAAALRLLNRLWGLALPASELAAIGARLGADVPACVYSRTARGEGVGDALGFIDAADVAGLGVLLVNPGAAVGTPQVFAAWDGIDRGPLARGCCLAAALAGRNDLEAPAIAICPAIRDVLDRLRRQDALMVRMSGSGATCFALFADPASAARASTDVAAADARWWTAAGKML